MAVTLDHRGTATAAAAVAAASVSTYTNPAATAEQQGLVSLLLLYGRVIQPPQLSNPASTAEHLATAEGPSMNRGSWQPPDRIATVEKPQLLGSCLPGILSCFRLLALGQGGQ